MKNATQQQISAAFTEWERRYREDPEKFATDQEHRAMSVETYGDQCAPYFLEILAEIKGGRFH